ncbi:MAG: hypothetical protein AB199_01085 [Parcubacteria bacterium C7867-004]|nr:MAG: hypothetical protein AB199_01085 [Parcubacteria bacterium C7867-004]
MNPFRLPLAELLLRLAVVISFLYPPISALTDPYSWIGYFPAFITGLVGTHWLTLLHVFGAIEVAIALWILLGKRVLVPATIAGVMLLAIVAFNIPQFPVLFRDISIALAAFVLAWMHRPLPHGTR